MKHLKILAVLAAFAALAVGAGAVIAALGDSETASGTITVSSESADLYICEPVATPGPACGADDSDGAEIIFEGDEAFIPGENQYYDIRLKNVGTRDFVLTGADLAISETTDPGNNCPNDAIQPGINQNYYSSNYGVWILGKAGDPTNDNETIDSLEFNHEVTGYERTPIYIAAGDYEDVRLRLRLDLFGTENCDGNEWNVTWTFVAN